MGVIWLKQGSTTGHVTKGGVKLTLYSSVPEEVLPLNLFHHHIARFLPGSSASSVNYQVKLHWSVQVYFFLVNCGEKATLFGRAIVHMVGKS